MAARIRFALTTAACERCGKPVLTGTRSLYGADALKAQLGVVCEGCTTEAERYEIARAIGAHIAGADR